MSLHKLTAGTGYDYLTRQVAAMDSTEKGQTSLADYYSQHGELPGRWVGAGLFGIDGLNAGDVVTAEQMQSLFSIGDHPLTAQRLAALDADATERDYRDAMKLGQRFGVYTGVSDFRIEVARRIDSWNLENGHADDDPVAPELRAHVRTDVGREYFRTRFGRDPLDARELSGFIARESRPGQSGVAGYDAAFSPVKSVSALWALADPATAAIIQRCHDQAVSDALGFLEANALYTRRGRGVVRQVEVTGLVAAAFTHRDSRAGDPDLHTHVAIANKVQAVDDGAWLAIDGRVMFKANVSASEFYNTALETQLIRALGVRFENRPGGDPERPVRELVGMDPALLTRWSQRDAVILQRQAELSADFQNRHGRTPTPTEQHALSQRATVTTRQPKHEPRSLAEQRRVWLAEAEAVLGSGQVRPLLRRVLSPSALPHRAVDDAWLDAMTARVTTRVESRRATWQVWHVQAEALRQVRIAGVADPVASVEQIVERVCARHSIRVSPVDAIAEPAPLLRPDGTSVYVVAGSTWYSSQRVLDAEARLLAIAGRRDGMVAGARSIDLALLQAYANGVELNAGQVDLVRAMASSGARLQVAIAPAGAGKTTAMHTLATAWVEAGGDVLGLAPSAAAADALSEQLGGRADTLHLLTHGIAHDRLPAWAEQIGPRTLVVIDEAGMADTLTLEKAVSFIVARGGSVRLIGDDHQLSAVEAGGVLRDIAAAHGAVRLSAVVRFSDPAEADASLALRQGRASALGFYLDHRRVHVGDAATTLDQAFAGWSADRAAGLDSLMLAPTRDLVAQLNARARTQRLAGVRPGREVELADGTRASVGDTVVTRRNERRLRYSRNGWVRNGDRWTVVGVGRNHSMTVARHGWQVSLPADYVRVSVQLGYASTIHGAQGATVETMHGVLTGAESRQQLYTMMTRGRHANHAYLQVVGEGDAHSLIRPEVLRPPTPAETLESILARDEAAVSATSLRRQEADAATLLKPAVDRYVDALGFVAEQLVGAEKVSEIRETADRLVLWLSDEPAWPVLQSQLVLLAASGRDPVDALRRAVTQGDLDDARDPAAVLSWRLEPAGGQGPLPWLGGVPELLQRDPLWGPYLAARQDLVRDLAAQVAELAESRPQPWQEALALPPTPELAAQIAVWRAAQGVDENDVCPTGSASIDPSAAAVRWQRHLDEQLTTQTPELRHWTAVLHLAARPLRDDPQTPVLARTLAALSAKGEDVNRLLARALSVGPLPDDHAASALQYRIEHPPQFPPTRWEPITSPSTGTEHERLRPPGLDPRPGHGIGF